MAHEPIITDKAQKKMREHKISKKELMAAFHSRQSQIIEKSLIPGTTQTLVRMGKYEIGLIYTKRPGGPGVIITCWKRRHY